MTTTRTLTASFVPVTELKTGMTTSLGEITALRSTAKRVYVTVTLATSGKPFESHHDKGSHCVILSILSTDGPAIAAAIREAVNAGN